MAVLKTPGRDDGQDAFGETAAGRAVGTERALAPQDGIAQAAFGMIVGGRDAFIVQERPELGLTLADFSADTTHADGRGMVGGVASRRATWRRVGSSSSAIWAWVVVPAAGMDAPGASTETVIVPDAAVEFDQRLEVALEMRPAPLLAIPGLTGGAIDSIPHPLRPSVPSTVRDAPLSTSDAPWVWWALLRNFTLPHPERLLALIGRHSSLTDPPLHQPVSKLIGDEVESRKAGPSATFARGFPSSWYRTPLA